MSPENWPSPSSLYDGSIEAEKNYPTITAHTFFCRFLQNVYFAESVFPAPLCSVDITELNIQPKISSNPCFVESIIKR